MNILLKNGGYSWLDRFVGNETGPPQAARRVKARERLSFNPEPQQSKQVGVGV
jgi:hypothetical protein